MYLVICVLSYLLAWASIFPFAYMVGGFAAFLVGSVTGFVASYSFFKMKNWVVGFFVYLSVAFSALLVVWLIFHTRHITWNGLFDEFKTAFLMSFLFVLGCFGWLSYVAKNNQTIEGQIKNFTLFSGLVAFSVLLFLHMDYLFFHLLEQNQPLIFGLIHGVCSACVFSFVLRYWIIPGIYTLGFLLEYIKVTWIPVSTFFVGYVVMSLVFGGLFALVAYHDPKSFVPVSDWPLNEYLYYSFTIVTTLGNANIVPATSLTRWITIVEIMLNIVWMTVILAASIGYVQAIFTRITPPKIRNNPIAKKIKETIKK